MVSQVKPYLKCVPSLSTTNVPDIFCLFCHIDYPHLISNSQIRTFFEQIQGVFQGQQVKGVKAYAIGMIVNRSTGKCQNRFFLFVRGLAQAEAAISRNNAVFLHTGGKITISKASDFYKKRQQQASYSSNNNNNSNNNYNNNFNNNNHNDEASSFASANYYNDLATFNNE